MSSELLQKIQDRRATIVVIGLGYVGLPLAVAFAEAGFLTTGIDIDQERVECLLNGKSYIPDVPTDELAPLIHSERLTATTQYEAIADSDVAVICVPTPLSKTKDPDLSYVISTADEIARYVHEGMLVVLESTTYPGTTEEIILPRFVENGYRVGEDVFVAFSPERIDPGRQDYTLANTPKVVGGMTQKCLKLAEALYAQIVETVVPVSSTQAAEMVKLLENTFRAVNIALANEIALMCDRLGINVWEVIDAAATKPYGFSRFEPGPGLGGHCIPIDPMYLSWKLRSFNYRARFIELASDINSAMPEFWVNKVVETLNEAGKPVKSSHILAIGVTYKRDTNDIRESPALDLIRLLQEKGAKVTYHDPYVSKLCYDELTLS